MEMNPDGNRHGNNRKQLASFSSRPNKTRDGHRGHVINKIDVDRGHRIFIVRYSDDSIGKTYVMLVGILLAAQRKKSFTWRDEAARIRQKFGGVVFESENEEVDDLIYDGGKHLTDYGAGFLDKYTPEETESIVSFGLSQIDTNITLTYDQISAVEKVLPLVIDGHAGTGKSVIIALRSHLKASRRLGTMKKEFSRCGIQPTRPQHGQKICRRLDDKLNLSPRPCHEAVITKRHSMSTGTSPRKSTIIRFRNQPALNQFQNS